MALFLFDKRPGRGLSMGLPTEDLKYGPLFCLLFVIVL